MAKIGEVFMVHCPLCKKPNNDIAIVTKNTKQDVKRGSLLGEFCKECKVKMENVSRLICRSCGQLLAYMEPGITGDGFEIKPKTEYHTKVCDRCVPGLKSTFIEEIQEYHEQKGKDEKGNGKVWN